MKVLDRRIERAPRRRIFPPSGAPRPIHEGAALTALAQPGRIGEVGGEKPGGEEVPWRSRWFVSARDSADGNSYAPGEPVSQVEAARQGLIVEEPPEPVRIAAVCSRCKGRGIQGGKVPPGHKPGCRCWACAPCGLCGGSGFQPEEEEAT